MPALAGILVQMELLAGVAHLQICGREANICKEKCLLPTGGFRRLALQKEDHSERPMGSYSGPALRDSSAATPRWWDCRNRCFFSIVFLCPEKCSRISF